MRSRRSSAGLGRRNAVRALLALSLLLLWPAAMARAGTLAVGGLRTVTGADGFQLLAPIGWQIQSPAGQGLPTLRQTLVSADGRETLRVYVSEQTIGSSDIGIFAGIFLRNVTGSDPDPGQPQPAAVPGAVNSVVQMAHYTDASGTRMADSAVVAATGARLYVLELSAPDDFATVNADLIQAILQSFAVAPAG